MTQEEKQLLLQDICGRLPYGLIYRVSYRTFPNKELKYYNEKLKRCEINTKGEYGVGCNGATLVSITKVKPYLRPMSSMTNEEKEELLNLIVGKGGTEYFHITNDGAIVGNHEVEQDIRNFELYWINFNPLNVSSYIDYLNKKMFDFRGLIPKDLAISTEVFNPYKD